METGEGGELWDTVIKGISILYLLCLCLCKEMYNERMSMKNKCKGKKWSKTGLFHH
jgi:hypothetical protein